MATDVTADQLEPARRFLAQYPETSLLLLSNLRAFGPRVGESLYSGNFKALVDGGRIQAVWCLTRGGNLIAQTGGRADLAPVIARACDGEPFPVRGVLGEWTISEALWDLVSEDRGLRTTFRSREISYRRDLVDLPATAGTAAAVRLLTPDDHSEWSRLSGAFLAEQRLPEGGTFDERRAAFSRSAALGHWWGAVEDAALVSLAGYIALYDTIAQVGGVYTPPASRRRGLSRAVMQRLMHDSVAVHRLTRLFLFTGEENVAARTMYEALGFEAFGHFGLFFGDERTC